MWTAATSIVPAIADLGYGTRGNRGTFIALYLKGSGGGITATVNQLWVAEDGL